MEQEVFTRQEFLTHLEKNKCKWRRDDYAATSSVYKNTTNGRKSIVPTAAYLDRDICDKICSNLGIPHFRG